ncbi:MAG: DUF1273 domain-containing protein [Clostridiales bacterium]|nr:DUF1273 domain-containing protein [Clostridiales bacterium]
MEREFRINMNRPITCAFSGHRPHKAPGMFRRDGRLIETVRGRLDGAVRAAVIDGYKFFMSGGGLGFDLEAADSVLSARTEFPFIKLILALPCRGHSAKWLAGDVERLARIAGSASEVVYVSDAPYRDGCMLRRNEYLIDHASMLICAYGRAPGGTRHTLGYAKKCQLRVVSLLDPAVILDGPWGVA